ncbi:HNH endonuclease [Salinibaculum rarum]|uniref:HNH endonuclease n=1 Tax=Salinibaculum rarum TaxID=3058903 RepID=UPI00265ED5E8|nr:HNH endonuclease signature motif containing protein [Salinibaculum sp. KK48]
MTGHDVSHETVDPGTRDDVLTAAGHRCQWCGRDGPGAGGVATLHVHHATRDLDEMDEHDPANLTAVCRRCHNWLHNQPSNDEAPVEITEADLTVLLPQDVEIIQVLAANGPIRTGDIVTELTPDLSVTAVRERLWVLMGLDNTVEERNQQIVDQDADTGEWGLAEQVSNSSRGRIPDDPQTLLQRAEDERVRQALDRGCDRDAVADVIGVCSRTTWHKEKRARAYDLPLDALDDKGGRPPANDRAESAGQPATGEDDAAQLQLDSAAEKPGESTGDDSTGGDEPTRDTINDDSAPDEQPVADGGDVQTRLRQTIQALEALDAEL